MNKNECCVLEISKKDAKDIITTYHYLGIKPFRSSVCYGLFKDTNACVGELIGACVFHGVSAPETVVGAFGLSRKDQKGFWELGRLVLDKTYNGGNYGSYLVGRSIRLLKQNHYTRAIISYADSSLHSGGVYRACNFIYCGLSTQKKDFYINGKIQERGKTRGIKGEWKPRPRKHRYIMIFDKTLKLKWEKEGL